MSFPHQYTERELLNNALVILTTVALRAESGQPPPVESARHWIKLFGKLRERELAMERVPQHSVSQVADVEREYGLRPGCLAAYAKLRGIMNEDAT